MSLIYHDDSLDLIAERVESLRTAKGWSQVMAAKKLNVARATYLALENAEISPKWSLLVRVMNLYHCDPAWLLGLDKMDICSTCPVKTSPRLLRALEVYTGESLTR